jgi:hypothetical protein
MVLAPSAAVGADKPARRYEAPHDGRPGVVHIDEYFELDNPREASRLLLEEAAIAQRDVDRVDQTKPNDTMMLGSGTAAPNFSDRSLVERAAELTSQGAPDQEFICLLKMSRYPGIRETANIMALGVRIYRGIPYYTYIERVNAATVPSLLDLDPVVWIGELTPELKYPQDKTFYPGGFFHVFSLVGDTPECRADLAELGATILTTGRTTRVSYEWEKYVINVDVSRISDLAQLWWVHFIYHELRVSDAVTR